MDESETESRVDLQRCLFFLRVEVCLCFHVDMSRGTIGDIRSSGSEGHIETLRSRSSGCVGGRNSNPESVLSLCFLTTLSFTVSLSTFSSHSLSKPLRSLVCLLLTLNLPFRPTRLVNDTSVGRVLQGPGTETSPARRGPFC